MTGAGVCRDNARQDNHWLWLVIAGVSCVYLLIGLSAPLFWHFDLAGFETILKLGRTLCVQRPTKCIWYLGEHTALCGKCLGLYSGILIVSISAIIIKGYKPNSKGAALGAIVFVVVTGHSVIRTFAGGFDPPVALNYLFGLAAGAGLGIFFWFLLTRRVGGVMSAISKRWLLVLIIVVAIHVLGFSQALAQDKGTGDPKAPQSTARAEPKDEPPETTPATTTPTEPQAQATTTSTAPPAVVPTAKIDTPTEAAPAALPKNAKPAAVKKPKKKRKAKKRKAKKPKPKPTPEPMRVMVQAGTPVVLEIESGFSSEDVQEGDTIYLVVRRPVMAMAPNQGYRQVVVVRQGVAARAKVMTRKAAEGWGAAGSLALTIQSVPAVDGSELMLRGRTSRKGKTSTGEATAVAVVTGVICLPLAFTGAAVTGEEGCYPAGYEIVAHTDGARFVAILSPEQQAEIAVRQEQESREAREKFTKRVEELKKQREEEKKRQEHDPMNPY